MQINAPLTLILSALLCTATATPLPAADETTATHALDPRSGAFFDNSKGGFGLDLGPDFFGGQGSYGKGGSSYGYGRGRGRGGRGGNSRHLKEEQLAKLAHQAVNAAAAKTAASTHAATHVDADAARVDEHHREKKEKKEKSKHVKKVEGGGKKGGFARRSGGDGGEDLGFGFGFNDGADVGDFGNFGKGGDFGRGGFGYGSDRERGFGYGGRFGGDGFDGSRGRGFGSGSFIGYGGLRSGRFDSGFDSGFNQGGSFYRRSGSDSIGGGFDFFGKGDSKKKGSGGFRNGKAKEVQKHKKLAKHVDDDDKHAAAVHVDKAAEFDAAAVQAAAAKAKAEKKKEAKHKLEHKKGGKGGDFF